MNNTQPIITAFDGLALWKAAQSLGRRGGLKKSKAKTTAARLNGRRGGRPKETASTLKPFHTATATASKPHSTSQPAQTP